jgi:hypothetical protein
MKAISWNFMEESSAVIRAGIVTGMAGLHTMKSFCLSILRRKVFPCLAEIQRAGCHGISYVARKTKLFTFVNFSWLVQQTDQIVASHDLSLFVGGPPPFRSRKTPETKFPAIRPIRHGFPCSFRPVETIVCDALPSVWETDVFRHPAKAQRMRLSVT